MHGKLVRTVLCCAALAASGSGCAAIAGQATFFTHLDEFDKMPPWGTVYCGTFIDLGLALGGGIGCVGPSLVGHSLGIVDLPLSLALETAILPLTFGETVAIAVRRGKEEAEDD